MAFGSLLPAETVYGGFGWHRVDVVAEYGQEVITNYHIVSFARGLCSRRDLTLNRFDSDNLASRNILDAEHQLLKTVPPHPLHQGLSSVAFDHSVPYHMGWRSPPRHFRNPVHAPHLPTDTV